MDTSFKNGLFSALSAEELLSRLETNAETGLSKTEATRRSKLFAKDVLNHAKKSKSIWKIFLQQFNSPLIFLLLFATILSLILGSKIDSLIILAIVFLSALTSFFQESRAVRTMEKLLALVRVKTMVLREGVQKEIDLHEVVPGDIIILNAGDVIPADCYLLEAKDLYVDEAALTGESFNVEKIVGAIAQNSPLAKRTNSLFMGTHVVSGNAKAVAVHVGKQSEFGQLSQKISAKAPLTEFEHGIHQFGYFLMKVTLVMLVVLIGFNIYFSKPLIESILFATALSVGMTPQLLPAIVTVNLMKGAKMMAKKKVIIKKLVSIENFASIDVLCADKTGTLTTGEIAFHSASDFAGQASKKAELYGVLNATFQSGYSNPIDTALLHREIHLTEWKKLDEIPYDFSRKRISLLAAKDKESVMITKGSFNEILSICKNVEGQNGEKLELSSIQSQLASQFEAYSNEGYRVLAIAYRDGHSLSTIGYKDETEMTFLGFLLFEDPLKDDIQKVVLSLQKSGVQLKLITGDNRYVAKKVASQLGIPMEGMISGAELNEMNDATLDSQVVKNAIFSEIEPNQKERIIQALKKIGHVVGYLGDGINDIAALHLADVGIAVDSGVDALKEAADIVLLKKDLSILHAGIEAGRKTFMNTLKYIFMATSANFGNMFSMAGASLFLPFLPLLPKQVLLTNFLTDLPEMLIATDKVDRKIIEKPLRWNIHFIRKFMIIFGLISSIFDFATFGILRWVFHATEDQFRTGWFIESVVSACCIVLVVRTFGPFFRSKPSHALFFGVLTVSLFTFLIPLLPFSSYLGFVPLPINFYFAVIALVMLYILFVELAKKAVFHKNTKPF